MAPLAAAEVHAPPASNLSSNRLPSPEPHPERKVPSRPAGPRPQTFADTPRPTPNAQHPTLKHPTPNIQHPMVRRVPLARGSGCLPPWRRDGCSAPGAHALRRASRLRHSLRLRRARCASPPRASQLRRRCRLTESSWSCCKGAERGRLRGATLAAYVARGVCSRCATHLRSHYRSMEQNSKGYVYPGTMKRETTPSLVRLLLCPAVRRAAHGARRARTETEPSERRGHGGARELRARAARALRCVRATRWVDGYVDGYVSHRSTVGCGGGA